MDEDGLLRLELACIRFLKKRGYFIQSVNDRKAEQEWEEKPLAKSVQATELIVNNLLGQDYV